MSESGLRLRILTPQGVAYDNDVESFLVPTEQGPLLIERGYTNLISTLSPAGVLRIDRNGKKAFFAIFGGVLQVNHEEGCSIFSEEIDDGASIDLARAQAARDRNLDRINSKDPNIDINRAKAKLAKALTRINVKTLSQGGQR